MNLAEIDIVFVKMFPEPNVIVIGWNVNQRIGHHRFKILRQDLFDEKLETIFRNVFG